MQITETIDYAATPAQVFAMLSDQAFQDRKCVATGATEHVATVTSEGERTIVTAKRSMPTQDLDLPSFINLGPSLAVTEIQDWGPASADGSRQGTVSVALADLPLKLTGTLGLAPSGAGTTETIKADLKASIPLLGGKIEKTAAPAIVSAIRVERECGEAWLAQA